MPTSKAATPNRRSFLLGSLAAGATAALPAEILAANNAPATQQDRTYWIQQVELVSEPVLKALKEGTLRRKMPVEAVPGQEQARAVGTHLEALGRLLSGLAPWLELEPTAEETQKETALRNHYRDCALAGINSALDPSSPDYMHFGESSQTLVDSSFLALALLRAPRQLLNKLDARTQQRLAEALVTQRKVQPPFNNWLLFAAMNEALLMTLHQPWDRMRVDYALRELQSWYLGDGTYGDGPHFHWDFYNSFVIQPYLLQLMDTLGDQSPSWSSMRASIHGRAQRYAAIQERLIAPDGSYPAIGRSITYRCGAFHLLADASRRKMLPDEPDRTTGPLRPVRSHEAHPRSRWHILQQRLAADRPRRPSTRPRRDLHLHRKPLPLQRSLAAPRPSTNRPILVATPGTLDITNHLVRKKHSSRPRP